MDEPIRSPFYEAQAALGATFMEEAGWLWTESFGDPVGERNAVRGDLGLWDVSPLNKWDFRGPDALAAAQRLHAGDVLGLSDGQVRYGPFCDAQGLMIDDGTVFRFSEQHAWVMTNGAGHAEHFADVTAGLDVEIELIGPRLPHLGLLGPRARDALSPICEADVTALRYFHFYPEPTRVGGVPCWVSRTGFGGELGFELFCRPEDAQGLWAAVLGATGARPFGVEAIEILRIEAGLVILDYDYEAHQVSPYDLSMDRLVALDGRPFQGSDALARLAPDPPRRLKTLLLDGLDDGTLPEYGAAVVRGGEPAGVLTSPTRSPVFGAIGLAILPKDLAADGERLEVRVGDGTTPATVAGLPVYDPQKLRPRA